MIRGRCGAPQVKGGDWIVSTLPIRPPDAAENRHCQTKAGQYVDGLVRRAWVRLYQNRVIVAIGSLLYLFYMQGGVEQSFEGEKITIFMYYILNEMPDGLRGLVTVGAIAAALSSTNSVLSAMASIAVEDLYKPWRLKRGMTQELHFVKASRLAVLFFAVILSFMAMASYFWQRYSDLSLISFAIGVMAFAYTGLLGVYFSAIFTSRGNNRSVLWGLIGGFATVLALQPYSFGIELGFSWQIVIGTAAAFLIVQLGGAKSE